MPKSSKQSKPRTAKSKEQPEAIARRVVAEVFDSIETDAESLTTTLAQPKLDAFDSSFERIWNLLFEEEGRPVAGQDDAAYEWLHIQLGIRAGYMVGVQVGMRLRGGAR
jgi:hypothetical protein